MRPVSSSQGGHDILHIATNEIITRGNVTVLPITSSVTTAVEALAKRDGIKGFTITTKHFVTLYSASTAGVDREDNNDDKTTTMTTRMTPNQPRRRE
jgi:hypothetical protein